jgi:hypothetical protein
MAAALQLKNQLTSKDEHVKLAHQQRWLALEDRVRIAVKTQASIVNIYCIVKDNHSTLYGMKLVYNR